MQKKVLVIYYSQSGQLESVIDSILNGLEDKTIEIKKVAIKPKKQFAFPWNFFDFMSIFPECVYMDKCEVELLGVEEDFDLVLLGYQPWFLSPSLPISGFLKSNEAKMVLHNKPVVTVIACRNMWLMAQEKVKKELNNLGARLIANAVLIDQGSSLATFITTPRWMFTGKKEPFLDIFPPAGIAKDEIKSASRFGFAIKNAIQKSVLDDSILKGLKAASSDKKLIKSEEIGHKSFLIWGKLIKKISSPNTIQRKAAVSVYLVFLILLIITVVPINMLLQQLLSPLLKAKTDIKKEYYDKPSGDDDFRMKEFE